MLISMRFSLTGESMAPIRRRLIVEGYVQGVFFRATTQEKALEFEVSGWVRNRWDGTVEVLVEGDEGRVAQLVQWCHQGPPGARVMDVRVEEEPHKGEFTGFDVRYG
jgi:acylphosphatase